ncbi:MAG: GDSL-type esterase/lipase family protein [bacterium]|nr:GDSL-type esterase/lipase family protein [bacterium]
MTEQNTDSNRIAGTAPESDHTIDVHSKQAKIICLLFALFLLLTLESASRLIFVEDHLDTILAFLKQDPELFWRQRPNAQVSFQNVAVTTDRFGFRNSRLPDSKESGTFRIICMGASPTFGWGVDYDKIYSSRLAARLKKEYSGTVEVFNGSVIGYTTHQGLRLLKKHVVKLQPDLITVSYVLNDLDRYRFFRSTGTPDRSLSSSNPVIIGIKNMLFRSAFLRLVEKLSFHLSARNVGFDKFKTNIYFPGARRVPPEHYTENLNHIIEFAREKGIKVLLLKMPVNLPSPEQLPETAITQANALLQKALKLAETGRHDEALVKLAEAVKINKYLSEAYYWLGVCSRKKGDTEEAVNNFQKAKDMESFRCGQDGHLYNRLMAELAVKNGLPLVDVVSAFRAFQDEYLFVDPKADPLHPNARGHEIIADLVYQGLKQHSLLPAKP